MKTLKLCSATAAGSTAILSTGGGGPYYAHALTLQEHRYGHAILLMARPADCLGLSGYNSYHNAQYFHLGGDDVQADQHLTFTIRLVLLTEWDDLQAEALDALSSMAGGIEE